MDRTIQLVTRSAEIEVLMSEFYSSLSKKVDDHQLFWKELSEEELHHGELLQTALKSLGHIDCFPDQLVNSDLKPIIKAKVVIEQEIQDLEAKESISCKEACALALYLEKVSPELSYQQFMVNDSGNEISDLLKAMNEDEMDHILRIKRLYNKLQ